ncbi:hypothetical protein AUQ48_13245 [Kocuria flava]|uniref:Uncharacterized protein n=1 Tax=Kocuria flava TaxID=446860 RepID=A0A2N4T474_9MICC|nr:hypothetical protein AUQ48_13245 [Kocuria flava]
MFRRTTIRPRASWSSTVVSPSSCMPPSTAQVRRAGAPAVPRPSCARVCRAARIDWGLAL